LGEHGLGHVLDGAVQDFVDEGDVLVFARGDAGKDLASRDLGIDDGLAAAPPVVDHHDKILHENDPAAPVIGARQDIYEKRKKVKCDSRKSEIAAYLPFLRGRADLARS